MRHTAHPEMLSALHPHDTAVAGSIYAEGGFGLNGGKAGDDVVTVVYPDSTAVNGGKGSDLLVVDWSADDNNVNVTLTASAGGGFDGTITDSALSATVQFTSFERFDITSGKGADALYGGAGADTLNGGRGADLLTGGAGDDVYVVDNKNDILIEDAGGGVDTVETARKYGLGANLENLTLLGDTSLAGLGNAADNRIVGNDAGDLLSGQDGVDTLIGGLGQDTLKGGDSGDHMEGGAGNDIYYVDNLGDVVVEGADGGRDTIYVGLQYGGHVQMADNVEDALATDKNQYIIGNDLDNAITGYSDLNPGTLVGGAGDDILTNGVSLIGGTGDDTYVITQFHAHDGIHVIEQADEGVDTVISYSSFWLPANVENLVLLDSSSSGYGNDLNNVITGNAFNNTLEGGAGADTLLGGDGVDTVTYQSAASGVTVDLSLTTSQRTRGEGADTLSSFENLTGSAFDDRLTGTESSNSIAGGAGNDTVTGAGGGDTLLGEAGNDSLVGGDQADTLTGGAGSDTLVGGLGADVMSGGDGDTFIYRLAAESTAGAADTLTLKNADKIDLSLIDADTTTSGDQAFHRVAVLDGHAGELVLVDDSGTTTVQGDVDGDGDADLFIVLPGDHLDFNNFVL